MCSYWKEDSDKEELSLDEIKDIYRNPLFSRVEKLVLSGGEPTLREDLVQIAQVILDSCPQIREMTLITNGLEPVLVTEKVKELMAQLDSRRATRLSVSVSLDGYGDTHDRIRRVPQAFERASETIYRLKEIQDKMLFYLCSTCVVQPQNINNLTKLVEFGHKLGLPITFSPICVSNLFVRDDVTRDSLKLTDASMAELRDLLSNRLQPFLTASNALFWRKYFRIIEGERRRLPCFELNYYANLDSDGSLRMCSADNTLVFGNVRIHPPDEIWHSEKAKELRKRVSKNLCPTCSLQCDLAFSLSHEFFYYARFWLEEKMRKISGK